MNAAIKVLMLSNFDSPPVLSWMRACFWERKAVRALWGDVSDEGIAGDDNRETGEDGSCGFVGQCGVTMPEGVMEA